MQGQENSQHKLGNVLGMCEDQQECLCAWSIVSRREAEGGGVGGLAVYSKLVGFYSECAMKTL